jgi:hypothetical protein
MYDTNATDIKRIEYLQGQDHQLFNLNDGSELS